MRDVKVKEYLKLNDVTIYEPLKFINGSLQLRWFKGKDIKTLKYSEVMKLRRFTGDYESLVYMFCTVFSMTEVNFLNLSIVDFFKGLNYFRDQLKSLVKYEEYIFNVPKGKYSGEWKEAQDQLKIDLSHFKELNIIRSLIKETGWTFEYIESMDYLSLMQFVYLNSLDNCVRERFNDIIVDKQEKKRKK